MKYSDKIAGVGMHIMLDMVHGDQQKRIKVNSIAEWSPLIPSVFDPLRFKGLGMEPLETDQGAARHAWAARVAQPTSASVCRVAR